MKKIRFYRGMILMALLVAVLAGCGGGGGGPKDPPSGGLSSLTYGGADAKGDHIAITIDASASTLTFQNYTDAASSYGPISFSKVTDPARTDGFQNLYRTDAFPGAPNRYAQFVIANGAAIIYQVFDNSGSEETSSPVGTPSFAFYRKDVLDLSDYKEKAFNWVNFLMDLNSEGNFEVGFFAIDKDNDGTWYGAGYDNRKWVDEPNDPDYDHGVHKSFGENGIKTTNFSPRSDIVAHKFENVTLIATQSNDFVLDGGANAGAYYAIRQATTNAWQSAYNGRYFLLVYENSNDINIDASISSMKLVLSGRTYQISQYGSTMLNGTLFDVESGGGPDKQDLFDLFKRQSGCNDGTSNIVKDAYKCRGSFIGSIDGGSSEGSSALYLVMDPKGQYLCVTIFKENNDGTYNYWFGFGVKG